MKAKGPDMYSLFKFEALHNSHPGISKMLKECVVWYFTSNEKVTKVGERRQNQSKLFAWDKKAVLAGCIMILSWF